MQIKKTRATGRKRATTKSKKKTPASGDIRKLLQKNDEATETSPTEDHSGDKVVTGEGAVNCRVLDAT